MKRILLIAMLSLSIPVALVCAAAKPEPPADHPLLPRFPGSEITAFEVLPNREYVLPIGPMTGGAAGKTMKLKGKLTRITYSAPAGSTSADVMKYFEKVFNDGDFQLFFSAAGEELAPHALWAETYYPETEKYFLQGETRHQGFIAARRDASDGDMCAAVYVSQGWYMYPVIQLDLLVLPSGKASKAAANRFMKDLRDNGRAVTTDIPFSGTELKAGAEQPLNELASLLRENRKVQLYIVAHTDNSRPYAELCELALARARAVKDYLVKAGIDENRLQEAGVGPVSPLVPHWDFGASRKNNRIEFIVK